MNRLVFLGVGGGGAGMMSYQLLKTGGKFVELDGVKFVIDPGPGTLVYARVADLESWKWDGVLVSHLHTDHSSDVNAIMDGIPEGFLVAEESCLKGAKGNFPCVSAYIQKTVNKIFPMKPGKTVKIKNLSIKAVKSDHYDPTVGFVIRGSRSIGYASDGSYYKGMEMHYEDCDALILNAMIPKGNPSRKRWHLSVDDAVMMINRITKKPRLVVLHHFGFWMIQEGIPGQARYMQKKTGARVIPAQDFMEINLDTMRIKSAV